MKKEMKAIDKLLFNSLVKHQGVNLPSVGSFNVIYEPAQMVADNIYPPRWRVAFSREESPELPSLVKMIEMYGKMDSVAAEKCYNNWLNEVKTAENYHFAGVGEIKDEKFIQSNTITAALAPEGFKSRKVKRRKSYMGVWFGAVLLVVLIAVGVYLYNLGVLDQAVQFQKPTQVATQPAVENVDAVADTTAVVATDTTTIAAPKEVAPVAPVAPVAEEVGRYVLSVGVFRDPINADKTVEEDPLQIGTENYKRAEWKGRTVLYVVSSDDKAEINRAYAKYVNIHSDIAIHDMEQ